MKEPNKVQNKKRNSKKASTFFLIATLIFIIITGVFITSIIKMNLLPGKYLTIFSLVELVLTVLIVCGLAKKHKTYKLNIFSLFLAIIFSVIYIFAINYASVTNSFLGNMFKEITETEDYYVVTQKNSNYNKITELKDKNINLFQIEDDVEAEIKEKSKASLNKKESLQDVGNSLKEGKCDAIAVSSSQYNMLDELIENFKADTKIIYTATHKIEKTTELDDQNSDYNIDDKAFNIYISGIDTSGKISNVSRSDANIIVTVNLKKHEILLTSIPRDYYVTLHSKKAKDKLTHSGIYGINETVTTVEDLLDIDINYYVRVNFTTVIKLVDTLGGVDVNSEYSFSTGTYSFRKGINHLDGDAALAFSRERHAFIDGDNQRVKNQQKVIEAIVNKVTGSTTILTKYTSILNGLKGCFQTNISQDEISTIVKDQLNSMPSWTIKNNSLVGTGSYSSTYSMGSQELYVMIPNSDSVKDATDKINAVLNK